MALLYGGGWTFLQVMTYKKVQPPPYNKAIQMPLLAHSTFKQDLKRHLHTNYIAPNKRRCLPFHIPTTSIREATHPIIATHLFNAKAWIRKFTIVTPTHCKCQDWLQQQPHLTTNSGHITASLAEFNFPQHTPPKTEAPTHPSSTTSYNSLQPPFPHSTNPMDTLENPSNA
jgi:hypothetical protein